MAALLRCSEVLIHSLVVLLVLVSSSGCSDPTQGNTTAVESRETKIPRWWPVLECVFLDDVRKCLQDRTVRAFVGLDRKDDIRIDTEKETVKLPGEKEAGFFEMLGDIVSGGILRIFQDDDKKGEDEEEDDDNDEEDEEADGVQTAENDDSITLGHANNRTQSAAENVHRSLETGSGRRKKKKKKKKKKMIKKAIIKLIILIILIKIKIVKFLYVFGKFLEFKLVLLITINTLINVIRFVMEWKKKKDSENTTYSYEQAHHQHHYDEHHHVDPITEEDDKGWLGGLWSRSGTFNGGRSVSTAEHAHNIAYSAHKPTQNSTYNAQRDSQDPARYLHRSTQDSARYRQTSAQDSARYRQTSAQDSAHYTNNAANYENKPAQNVAYHSYVQNSNANGQRSL